MNEKKVWLITGSSTGLGRALVEELLAQNYRVVATARKPEVLQEFTPKDGLIKTIELDVTSKEQAANAVQTAIQTYGRIDVLVNNAGYGLMGAIEEASEAQIRAQFETNFFGALNLIRAALPIMREQNGGHILNISSGGGFIGFASVGYYNASKFALEGLSEALAKETAHLGIKVTIVEPGLFRTDFNGRSLQTPENPLVEIYPSTSEFVDYLREWDGKQPGDPRKAAQAMIRVIESDNPPLRLPLGEDAVTMIEQELEVVRKDIAPWREIGMNTSFNEDSTKNED
jgi:NAD(P)-dependent dehydrogenase (short-subunit alcohol dehydrogenase family)